MRGRVILKGCGLLPERSILHQMSKEAYESNPKRLIGGFRLIEATPTLKFYLSDKTIVVAIRGTVPTDKDDVKADASIAINKLKSSARYQKDMSTILDVMRRYPASEYTYYGVGHSLGGAILDLFINEGWIKNGVSYNPAIQPKDLKKPISNQRIYQSGDPLYNVLGRFATNVEVRQPKKKTALEQLISSVPYVGTLFNALKSHQLENFEGGGKSEIFRVADKYENVVPVIKESLLVDAYFLAERELEDENRVDVRKAIVDSIVETLDAILRQLDQSPEEDQRRWFESNVGTKVEVVVPTRKSTHSKMRDILPRPKNVMKAETEPKRVSKIKKEFKPRLSGKGKTHRERFLQKHNLEDKSYSIEELSEISGIDKDILQEVYNRGIGAYKTNPTSVRMKGSFKKNVEAPMSQKLSKEQWAMARLYSFLDGNKKHDNDLRGGATGSTAFEDHLKQLGYSPKSYLSLARKKAKEHNYNPKKLNYARNGEHKLVMEDEEGKKSYFGRVGYNDFLIYSFLEKQKKVPSGTAESKRHRFQKSHTKIKGDWKSDDYSPNNLALRILW